MVPQVGGAIFGNFPHIVSHICQLEEEVGAPVNGR